MLWRRGGGVRGGNGEGGGGEATEGGAARTIPNWLHLTPRRASCLSSSRITSNILPSSRRCRAASSVCLSASAGRCSRALAINSSSRSPQLSSQGRVILSSVRGAASGRADCDATILSAASLAASLVGLFGGLGGSAGSAAGGCGVSATTGDASAAVLFTRASRKAAMGQPGCPRAEFTQLVSVAARRGSSARSSSVLAWRLPEAVGSSVFANCAFKCSLTKAARAAFVHGKLARTALANAASRSRSSAIFWWWRETTKVVQSRAIITRAVIADFARPWHSTAVFARLSFTGPCI